MHPSIRPATAEDVVAVGMNLKEDDRAELELAGREIAPETFRLAHFLSHKVFAWGPEGSPIAVFGVTPDWPEQVGYVWSISTPAILDSWREVHRSTPAVLDELGRDFLILANVKDARHRQHIRWLRSLGFTFIATHRRGPDGPRFHEFVRITKCPTRSPCS